MHSSQVNLTEFKNLMKAKICSAYWKSHKNDRALCFSADVPLFIHGMTNSLSDLYVFLLPLPYVPLPTDISQSLNMTANSLF